MNDTQDPERTLVERGGPPPPGSPPSSLRVALHGEVEAESVIGEGGMGVVYRGRQAGLEREVALKILRPQASRSAREGFEQEARIMALLDHPGIVSVYARSPAAAPERAFAMKLVEGRELAELIDRDHPPRGRALAAMLRHLLRMCETLAYAHDRGVVHRDLKPENIMLGRYGECYVMDWGLALDLRQRGPRPPKVLGTPAYMAPEQAQARVDDIDARTDVFGLGAILYFILCGRPPYAGRTVDALLEAAREGRTTAPEDIPELPAIPAGLGDILGKCLAPERERRYASAMELHAAVEQFLFTGEGFARRRLAAGALIVAAGDPGDRAFIIETGECEVFRCRGGDEQILRRIGAGEVIGELALFTAGTRTASVRALTPVTLIELTRETLDAELPAGSWTRKIIDSLARRFLADDHTRGEP